MRWDRNAQLGLVLRAPIKCGVDGYLLFADARHFDLRAALLALRMGSCPEDGCFAEHELETT